MKATSKKGRVPKSLFCVVIALVMVGYIFTQYDDAKRQAESAANAMSSMMNDGVRVCSDGVKWAVRFRKAGETEWRSSAISVHGGELFDIQIFTEGSELPGSEYSILVEDVRVGMVRLEDKAMRLPGYDDMYLIHELDNVSINSLMALIENTKFPDGRRIGAGFVGRDVTDIDRLSTIGYIYGWWQYFSWLDLMILILLLVLVCLMQTCDFDAMTNDKKDKS